MSSANSTPRIPPRRTGQTSPHSSTQVSSTSSSLSSSIPSSSSSIPSSSTPSASSPSPTTLPQRQRRRQQQQVQVDMTSVQQLRGVVNRQLNQMNEMVQQATPNYQEPEESDDEHPIFNLLLTSRSLVDLTNFTEVELRDLYWAIKGRWDADKRRGPKPILSVFDSMLVYIIYLKTNLQFRQLAAFLHLKVNTLQEAIARIRPYLLNVLKDRWWRERKRPEPLTTRSFPHNALLVDSSSFEVYRPRAPFEESKIYWDGKNHMYALKKEVAVMAKPPYFALFSQPAQVGSMHDYAYLKRTYQRYLPYLQKTPVERELLRHDRDHAYWAVACDLGYIGPETDTPNFRRITPKKGPRLTVNDLQWNTEVSSTRVYVECFFGRQQKLWTIARELFRGDHAHFDDDIDITILLTNEHIKQMALTDEDQKFYLSRMEARQKQWEERVRKRRMSQQAYEERREQRLRPRLELMSPSNLPDEPPDRAWRLERDDEEEQLTLPPFPVDDEVLEPWMEETDQRD